MSVADVVKMTRPSIGEVRMKMPFKRWDGKMGTRVDLGTAFVIDGNGDLVTNCHVVTPPEDSAALGKTELSVQFADDPNVRLKATVLGCDVPGDIAVIHVDGLGADRKPLRFADVRDDDVGQDVVAVGFVDGMDGEATVSRGIISALHRSYLDGTVSDLVQTDAALNYGDSGGPLLNLRGEVVGVNSYISIASVKFGDIQRASANKASSDKEIPVRAPRTGVSYARSAISAARYAHDIIAAGSVLRPDLGVSVKSPDFSTMTLPRSALYLKSVDPKGAAASIGFQGGEFVYAVEWPDGTVYNVWDQGSLNDALARIEPGEKVTFHFYRMTQDAIDAAEEMSEAPEEDVTWLSAEWSPLVKKPKLDAVPGNHKKPGERVAKSVATWDR